ncbi:hypothetical protein EN45_084790 [Penicillium chrysogenum]|uniref:Uncharacterized protein n=1 Tax=Penicillium chrysogenum TaxID=5076 RepID=A0A167UZX5_PENCH|nr:hypothetical protein EN45_084790 [Penicillium chrysogenum]
MPTIQPPAAPTTTDKVRKRRRARGGKKIRNIKAQQKGKSPVYLRRPVLRELDRCISCLVHIERERKLLTLRLAKELEEAASAAAAASGAGAESSAPPATSQPAASSPAASSPSSPAASTSAPSNSGVAVPAVGLAHRTTIASLVPELQLTDEETTALAGYLPDIIAAFVQDRRNTLNVPWDSWI